MSVTSISNDTISRDSLVNAQKPVPPTITGYTISGSDDTALDPAGGQTILLNGTGFQRGATITLNGNAIAVVSFVSSNQLSFTSPALSAGTYTVYVVNADLGTAIFIPGLIYSNLPSWTTSAGSLGSYYETTSISNTVVASGDTPITYSLASGSLPTGATLYANGVISGTAPADSGSTTYSFTVEATDPQLQSSTRSFSLTINTDVVTWTNPTNGATIMLDGSLYSNVLTATSAAGYNISSFTANTLPTGLALSGNTISGTPTVEGNVTTLLTATAATTGRSVTNTITWVVNLSDFYWDYVTTLLSATPTTLPFDDDASTNNFELTVIGETKPNNFNPYTPGYYSNYFDGTGDYLSGTYNTSFPTGNDAYTIEAWIYLTGTIARSHIVAWGTLASYQSNGFRINDAGNGLLNYWYGDDLDTGNIGIVANNWYHVVAQFDGTTRRIYLNGVSVASANTPAGHNVPTSGTFAVGSSVSAADLFTGYISNLRIVKGTAVYTSAFTPPTQPLTAITNTSLLTCQSNRFIDASANNFTITRNGDTKVSSWIPYTPSSSYSTYGSTYFDGEGDYVAAPNDQTAFGFGTGDFSIECWLYNQSTTSYIFFDTRRQNESRVNLGLANSGTAFNLSVGTTTVLTSTVSFPLNAWVHIAAVRQSGVVKLYVNGQAAGSASYTGDLGSSGSWCAATAGDARGNGSYDYGPGYIADMRVVKGTAVYTAAFTPPTAPLTAVSGTSLLTFQTNQPIANNTFLDNSTSNFSFTRNGNTTQGTFSPYGENWSNYFDGTGDYLSLPSNAAFQLGTGDFTIEAWMYFTASGVNNTLIDMRNGGTTAVGIVIFQGTNNAINYYTGGSTRITGSTLLTNTWYHIAASRSGTSTKLFVNGSQVGSTYTDTNNYILNAPNIGRFSDGSGGIMNGYISNFRIVKGTALYTTNFTPSTTPLQPIAGTSLLTCKDPSLVDDSANNFTITRNGDVSVQKFGPFAGTTLPTPYYSAYFDGTGDYLSLSTIQNFGTADFTVEAWVYLTAVNTNGIYASTGNTGKSRLYTHITNTSKLQATLRNSDGTNEIDYTGSTTINLNTWYHVAIVRYNNTLYLYVNGVSDMTPTPVTQNLSTNDSFSTVGSANATRLFNGYMSNLRVVAGTAVYTANFTPPTSPLTAITNTSLLTCQSSTLVDNSINNVTITVNGDTKPRTFNPFTLSYSTRQSYTPSVYGGSMYFDGTGDYLSSTSSAAIGTGPFTIEAWVYLNSVGTIKMIVDNGYWQIGNNGGYRFAITSGNVLTLTASTGAYNTFPAVITGTTALVAGQWYHVAAVRNSSNVINLYVNGVVAATPVTYSSSLNLGGGQTLKIGSAIADGGVYDTFNGYISDVRIIPGIALYNSNFAPSNAPLTAIKNTSLLLNGTGAVIYDSSEISNFETAGDAKLSTTVAKFSGSTSVYFDGTGDYLLAPTNLQYNLVRDFTIEAWVNFSALSSNRMIVDRWTSGNAAGWQLYWRSTGTSLTFYIGSAIVVQDPSTSRITTNTWYHIAVTRDNGTVRLFVDGVQVASATNTTSLTNTLPLAVGIQYSTLTNPFSGYISDFRITNGIARYTTNFTPPTELFDTK